MDEEIPWLFTSRYANRAIATSGLEPIGITLGLPRYNLSYDLETVDRRFAPTRELFHIVDESEFTAAFIDRLDQTVGEQALPILRKHQRVHEATGLVLLCFEDVRKPGEFCHRRILADWIRDRFGIHVPELDHPEDQPPSPVKDQTRPARPRGRPRKEIPVPDAPLFGNQLSEAHETPLFDVPEVVERAHRNFG